MALINDPDDVTYEIAATPSGTVMVTIDTTAQTITLNEIDGLTRDGITGQCIYSFFKERWLSDSNLTPFDFPMETITEEQYEFINDWAPADDATRKLIRFAGWLERKADGDIKREYAGIITLGTIAASDQAYYLTSSGSAVDFTYDGPVNEAIQTYGDVSNGAFDYRSGGMTVYVREQGKSYSSATAESIGAETLKYQVYRFPLQNSQDTKITANDATADNYGVTITWYDSDQIRTIDGTDYSFRVIVDGNGNTAEEIYTAVQSYLRKVSDIDSGAGTRIGRITNQLMSFAGDTLYTRQDTTGGVYIDNFDPADINRLRFVDNTGSEVQFPFLATLTLNFNSNLQDDPASKYVVYYTANPSGNIGTSDAVVVQDSSGADMAGDVSGNSSLSFSYAYDTNTQGGRTAGTDADITVFSSGLTKAQPVRAEGTIARSNNNSVTLVSSLERNYSNPV